MSHILGLGLERMSPAALCFWLSAAIVLYTYPGYGMLMWILVRVPFLRRKSSPDAAFEPEVALVVPCYNEKEVLPAKVENCLSLDYPKQKLNIIFVTDGSDDGSDHLLQSFSGISLLHRSERSGKAAAMNRAMKSVTTPVVIFCDANTRLNKAAIRNIVRHYADPQVGAVAGEKRVLSKASDSASASGEGLYWRYESWLKKMDSAFYSTIGGAGELMSFRTSLYSDLEHDTILDDFVQSMRIAISGYHVVYEPQAFAEEGASATVNEELKRKVRISAGAWQAMARLGQALNPFRNFRLAFTFISHKVFRWLFAPLALFALLPLNFYLSVKYGGVYSGLWILQVCFYVLAAMGWIMENRRTRVKLFFLPYYFFITNWSMVLGFIRYIKREQSVNWERAKRTAEF